MTDTPPERIWATGNHEGTTGSWNAEPVRNHPAQTPYVREDLQGWRDIESAPRDGRELLVVVNGEVTTAWFCKETGLWPHDEMLSEDGEPCNVGLPTHWMPLPPAPEAKT